MTVRTLPWWRKAIAFALDGIRSGFGLFRRNGDHEAVEEAALSAEAAAQSVVASRTEVDENKTEEPGEESRVNPTSPQSEPTAEKEQKDVACEPRQSALVAQEPAVEVEPAVEPEPIAEIEPAVDDESAVKAEPVADVATIQAAAVEESTASDSLAKENQLEEAVTPDPATVADDSKEGGEEIPAEDVPCAGSAIKVAEASTPAASPSISDVESTSESELTEDSAAATPLQSDEASEKAEMTPLEEQTETEEIVTEAEAQEMASSESESVQEAEFIPQEIEAPEQAYEPGPQEATAPQMDPAPAEEADPPAGSAVVTELEQSTEAAPREEEAETVKATVESMLEEAAILDPEATQEEESNSHPMETPAYQSEPEPEETTADQAAPVSDDAVETAEPAAEAAPAEGTVSEPEEEAVDQAAAQTEAAPAAEIPAQPPEPAIVTESASVAEGSSQEPESAPVAEAAPALPEEIAPTLPFAEKSGERTTAEKVAAALKARGEDADQSPFSVIVNQVYDGPLDLLLDLIRKQDIDIYDIPIARITAQFLAYVDRLRATDVDVAGEFIYTAALLIHIKSKMLLPRAPAGPDDTSEDPRRELVERLLEHERFKNAAQMLHEKQMLEAATWTNPGIREFKEDSEAEPEIAADTTDLVRVFSSILERARSRPILNLQEDSVTVGQMIQFLSRRLTMEDKPVALRRLLSHTNSERALIAMFLALLELVRLQAILLRQDRHFSEIFVKKHEGFESLMNQGLANARDDWR